MKACHKFNITQINSLVKAGAMCDTTDPAPSSDFQ